MREIRTSGSEGGGAETNQLSLPLSSTSHNVHAKGMDCRVKPGNDGRDCGASVLHQIDRKVRSPRRAASFSHSVYSTTATISISSAR